MGAPIDLDMDINDDFDPMEIAHNNSGNFSGTPTAKMNDGPIIAEAEFDPINMAPAVQQSALV